MEKWHRYIYPTTTTMVAGAPLWPWPLSPSEQGNLAFTY